MVRPAIIFILAALFAPVLPSGIARSEPAPLQAENEAGLTIRSRKLGRELKLDEIFYETSSQLEAAGGTYGIRTKFTRAA